MASTDDPKGYYRVLGLAPNASEAQILHAYREWAKKYHPDASGRQDASEFIRIKEAYDTLNDPDRRRSYDRSGASADAGQGADSERASARNRAGETEPSRKAEANRCAGCGAITAQPRYCVFYRVWSLIYYSRMEKPSGVYCGNCARRKAVAQSAFTWLLGWWSVYGVFWTPLALWKNLMIGEKPKLANARLLIHQGIYFAQEGQFDVAHACFEQAKQFAEGETMNVLSGMQRAIPTIPPKVLRDQWGWNPTTICIHTAPVVLLVAVVVLFSYGSIPHLPTAVSAPPDIRYVATASTPAWIPSGSGYTQAGIMPEFTTIQVTGASTDPKFIVGRIPDGRTVTVATSALVQGDGRQAKSRWCSEHSQAPPSNNEILSRRFSGPNRVTVQNLGSSDAVAQFRHTDGAIAISFFVAANSTAVVSNFPDGRYRLEFATGREWSRSCNLFIQGMAAQRFPDFDDFASTTTTYRVAEYTITPVPDGNVRPVSIDMDAFASGGN
jgi:hypothetical protein